MGRTGGNETPEETKGEGEKKTVGKNIKEECLGKLRNDVITEGMKKGGKVGDDCKVSGREEHGSRGEMSQSESPLA